MTKGVRQFQTLRDLRDRRGLSQSVVAQRLRITQPQVVKWEHGRAEPQESNKWALAELYGVTIDEIAAAILATKQTHMSTSDEDE